MGVKKITNDVRKDVLKALEAGELGPLHQLTPEESGELDSFLKDSQFWQRAETEPQLVCRDIGLLERLDTYRANKVTKQYIYNNVAYIKKGALTDEQAKLLVQDHFDAERRKFERLSQKFNTARKTLTASDRQRISEEVRIAVWRRDNGRCVKCGSRDRLEYDHIIPVALGGSSTVRNIELLCESCNRSKGAQIL